MLSADGGSLRVRLPESPAPEAVAVAAMPYAAREGDEVVVIGDGRELFVIGVISGRGKTSLEVAGDLDLHAVGGALRLAGDAGVTIQGPAVQLNTGKLEMVARSVVQTFTSVFQRVADVLHVHARQQVSISDEGSYSQAKTAAIQTEETVTINGKEVHLG